MKYTRYIIPTALMGFVALFIGLIISNAAEMNTENAEVKAKCATTSMYVIGNRGRLTPVYDCSYMDLGK